MKESNIIDYLKKLSAAGSYQFKDDVAEILPEFGKSLIVSSDMIYEDVHFLRRDGGFNIATKLLRVNLSDIASSGAQPKYYLLNYCISHDQNHQQFFEDFALGLKSTQEDFKISLIGGDTIKTRNKSDRLCFSVTIFGTIDQGKNLLRQNARSGDLIYVTDYIGDAYLGLQINCGKEFPNLNQEQKRYLLNRHLVPNPRVIFGQELVKNNLSKCACDISDGLIKDLGNICKSSNLSADIYLEQIPISKPAIASRANKNELINCGDDYELIFTIEPRNKEKLLEIANKLNLKVSNIGIMNDLQNNQCEVRIFADQNSKSPINHKIFNPGYEH